jgi:hypothetical protein
MKKTVATTRKGGTADQSLLARAFRWQKLLENGTYASIAEIARVMVAIISLRRSLLT